MSGFQQKIIGMPKSKKKQPEETNQLSEPDSNTTYDTDVGTIRQRI